MKILVTGGTGFIGSHLVEKLVNENHKVICLLRKTSKLDNLDKLDIEKIYGDICDISSIESSLEDIEIVYNIIGILGKWIVPDSTYWKIHVEGTNNILDSIIKNGRIKRYIHCSTAGVLGPITKLPSDETYPYNPTNIYEITKVESEKLVLEYYNKFNLPITIIRPELVYGPRDLHMLKMFQAIKKGIFPIFGDGSSKLDPIYIDDLIKAFMLVLYNEKAIGQIYLIGGEKLVSIKELTSCMAKTMGTKGPKIFISIGLANILADFAESMAKVFYFEPLLTRSRVKFFSESRGSTYEKAKKELGYIPNIGLEEGLRKTVDWYKKNDLL